MNIYLELSHYTVAKFNLETEVFRETLKGDEMIVRNMDIFINERKYVDGNKDDKNADYLVNKVGSVNSKFKFLGESLTAIPKEEVVKMYAKEVVLMLNKFIEGLKDSVDKIEDEINNLSEFQENLFKLVYNHSNNENDCKETINWAPINEMADEEKKCKIEEAGSYMYSLSEVNLIKKRFVYKIELL